MTDRDATPSPDDQPTVSLGADDQPTWPVASASPVASAAVPARPAGPRVRWGAIVWGLAFAAIAALELWILVDPSRRDATADWFASLSGVTAALVLLLAIGAVLLVAGIAGVARRLSSRS
ncbi:hypothetical protein ACGGZK_00955 [Agromyces sp. MMS24-K17]|uniref:hypothetical protein n=1 Tax=Agromyces sp. MMS24-K17 TaxID=3372850 RepID=UPI0037547063